MLERRSGKDKRRPTSLFMPPADNARPQKRWGKPRLFHLETDPAEAHDLAAANPQMVERLHEAWTRWSDPFPPAVSKTAGK